MSSNTRVSQLVKDLDLKAFHNMLRRMLHVFEVSQLVKDLDLKAFHNNDITNSAENRGVTACQRS